MAKYLGIEIDYERDRLIPEQGLVMLTKKGFYKREWERSPQESFARAATCFCFGDYELAQRIYDHVSLKNFTFASPVLSNAIDIEWPSDLPFDLASDWLEENKSEEVDGMPISCFLNFVSDTKESLVRNSTETRWLSMNGGGVGTYFSNRSPDEKSTGVMAHVGGYNADTIAYRQTSCYLGDTEVLTDSGWKKFSDIDRSEKVTMIKDDGSSELVYPEEWLVSDYEGDIYNFSNKHKGFDLHVTSNHNMVTKKDGGSHFELIEASDLNLSEGYHLETAQGFSNIPLDSVNVNSYEYSGKVYCCTVPSGKILVRSGDVPIVCGNSRRGSIAAYMDIDHPEVLSFLETRNPVGGDQNNKNFNINNALNITDDFMIKMIKGEKFELIDPKHGNTGRFLDAREVWEKIGDMRYETGEPYLNFIDTVNRNIPKWIKNPLYKVSQSNLCSW